MIEVQQVSLAAGLSLAAVALVWAAASDLHRFIIPNRVCALVAAGYLLAGLGLPLDAWAAGLATGIAVLAIGAVLFARGWVGGGDVKLAAAAALWAGPGFLSDFALVTSISGAALGLVLLSPLRRLLPGAAHAETTGFRQPMPFGAPLAAGGAWVLALHLSSNF